MKVVFNVSCIYAPATHPICLSLLMQRWTWRDTAELQPGTGRGAKPGPLISAGPAGSGQGQPGPFAERIPVSVRKSASQGGLRPGLTRMLVILHERQRASGLLSVKQGKWSDRNVLLQDHRDHPAPTGKRSAEIPKLHLIQSSKGPLSSPAQTWVNLIALWGKAAFQRDADFSPLRDASQGPVGTRMGAGGGWTSAAAFHSDAAAPTWMRPAPPHCLRWTTAGLSYIPILYPSYIWCSTALTLWNDW